MSAIKPNNNDASDLLRLIDPGDAETTAMALAMRDAQQSREEACARRDAAYQDRIDRLNGAADKLRDMAKLSIGSGIFQAAVGIGSSVCALPGLGDSPWAQAAGKLTEAARGADGCRIAKDGLQDDKQQLETQAEVASRIAERAADRVNEAGRLENAAKQMLLKLHDKRNAAQEAATTI